MFKRTKKIKKNPDTQLLSELPELTYQEEKYKQDLLNYFYQLASQLVQNVQYLGNPPRISLSKFRLEILSRWQSIISLTNVTMACQEGFKLQGEEDKERVFVPIFMIQKMTGDLLLQMRDFQNALIQYEALIIFSKDHQQESGAMAILGQIGYVLGFQRKHDQAIQYFKKQLQYAMDLNDKESELSGYDSIGMQYFYKGDLEKAKYYHDRMVRGKVEKQSCSELRRRNLEILNSERANYKETRVRCFGKLTKATSTLVNNFIESLVRGDMATTLEIGLQTSYSQPRQEDEQEIQAHRKPSAVPKIKGLAKLEEDENDGKTQQLPSPRQVSLGQAAGCNQNSFLLLPYYDGGRIERDYLMKSKVQRQPVKDRLLFDAPELEYLNKQPSHQYLPAPPQKSKDVVPRLVMKKNRNYFNLQDRESLAPKHDWLPLSKKIELRLTEAKELLDVCEVTANFDIKERVICTEREKKIKTSKNKLKQTRLSNLSHLSAIRTISPHNVSVRSTAESILKMIQDFYHRFLSYVQNELDKIYTQALYRELKAEGQGTRSQQRVQRGLFEGMKKRALASDMMNDREFSRIMSSRLDKFEEPTPTERMVSSKHELDFQRQNALVRQKILDRNRMLDDELLD